MAKVNPIVNSIIKESKLKITPEGKTAINLIAKRAAYSIAKNAKLQVVKRKGYTIKGEDIMKAANLKKLQKSPIYDEKTLMRILSLVGDNPSLTTTRRFNDALYTKLQKKIFEIESISKKTPGVAITPTDVYLASTRQ